MFLPFRRHLSPSVCYRCQPGSARCGGDDAKYRQAGAWLKVCFITACLAIVRAAKTTRHDTHDAMTLALLEQCTLWLQQALSGSFTCILPLRLQYSLPFFLLEGLVRDSLDQALRAPVLHPDTNQRAVRSAACAREPRPREPV